VSTVLEVAVAIVVDSFVAILYAFPGGLALMVLFGVLHAEASSATPLVGYWPSVLMVLLARVIWDCITGPGGKSGDAS
jgi:hypothetical protein